MVSNDSLMLISSRTVLLVSPFLLHSHPICVSNRQLREAAILAIGTVANSLHEVANTVHEAKVYLKPH